MGSNNETEVWYEMTQSQLDAIYEIICDNNLNEKLFAYIAEKKMTFEDSVELVNAIVCYPKGHSMRDFYDRGFFLFTA